VITHIVLFKLNNPEDAIEVKRRLEALPAQIAEIRHYEIGIDIVRGERNYEVSLISKFDTLETLQAYQVHPAHQDFVGYIRPVAASIVVVDYEG
jgi:hypothetical protein